MAVHILGIRHHGVGSAKMVARRLEELKPDIVLIEGPPEISEHLKIVGHEELVPPVAIMIYNTKDPKQSTFYPFVAFSPEWVAAKYANDNAIPLRALDLPAGVQFKAQQKEKQEAVLLKEIAEEVIIEMPPRDPIAYLADVAGFKSGEAWWEAQFEKNSKYAAADHFEAVRLCMYTLREEGIASSLDKENIVREAYMRNIIQATINELYENIVVVCGGWHAPMLEDLDSFVKGDQKILKKVPKSKVPISCAWIPWTNSRLSYHSGYGAGIKSPGWYEHQWKLTEDVEIGWLSTIAETFREDGVDISTAHVLETYRLAHALAALRNKAQISLAELSEAVHTVMCMGDSIFFELINQKVIVGEKIGSLPEDLPKVPLQMDFESIAKKLRLKFEATRKEVKLDLRTPAGLKKSIFFHRLELLDINWSTKAFARNKGTFKEIWKLKWNPQMQIALIDKAFYGNTVEEASLNLVAVKMKEMSRISDLVELVQFCIPAELFPSIDQLLTKISNESAISSDSKDLMNAIPGLVDIVKYGNVRKTDVTQIEQIVNRLFSKVCITLANTCYGLDEENSNELFNLIGKVDTAVKILEDDSLYNQWFKALRKILTTPGIHNVIVGCTVRLLLDNEQLKEGEADNLFSYYLSASNPPAEVAAWVEGFLKGSGLILIYDNRIWNLIFEWVDSVQRETFVELLPVLRRAFSRFQFGERRQIGEKVKHGLVEDDQTTNKEEDTLFDEALGASILPFIAKQLGY